MEKAIKEVIWEMPHVIFVHMESGDHCLIVEDTEVNDLVEDHLWDEYEYAATSVSMETPASIPVYYNFLAADLPVDRFVEALKGIDPTLVEQVFRLNNKA
jgi:hypothetical protein